MLEISSFYTCVPKLTIIWCMVPEMWSVIDRIFCHYGPFFPLLPTYGRRKSKSWKKEKSTWRYYHFTYVYHKWHSYDIWFFRYGVQQTNFFCHFGPFFCPLTLLTTWKIKILKNWKNPWRYHYFTQVYQKSWSYAILFLRHGM